LSYGGLALAAGGGCPLRIAHLAVCLRTHRVAAARQWQMVEMLVMFGARSSDSAAALQDFLSGPGNAGGLWVSRHTGPSARASQLKRLGAGAGDQRVRFASGR